MLLVNLYRFLLGGGEHVDSLFIGKDIFRIAENVQYLILDLLQCFLILRRLNYQLFFFSFQIRSFFADEKSEQLVSEALFGDHEVDHHYLRANLWQIVRVSQFGGHVKVEIVGIDEHILAHLQVGSCALLVGLLQENWSQSCAYFGAQVLYQYRRAELDAVLQIANEVVVAHLYHLQLSIALLLLQPAIALALRVDHQRPPSGVCHYDSVLDGEVIVG